MSTKPLVLAIVGPTASGKTALALRLARAFGGEIVSADSRQIYRGMDIGTAKPSAKEMRAVPHRLIDIKNPDENYTVADYQRDAIRAVRGVLARGKLPIIAGGTGLYVRAVVRNLDIPKMKADPALRAKIEKEIAASGLAAAFAKLVALDPEAAYVVDPKNPRRVVRALEFVLGTGRSFTAARRAREPLFRTLMIGLDPAPRALRRAIDRRVDMMMKRGLLREVRTLVRKYGPGVKAFDAIGYRELIAHLRGATTLAEAVAAIKSNTWRYAKRQMTWFRKDAETHWFRDPRRALPLAAAFLGKRDKKRAP